ncbi:MAG: septum formation initiator family protein [Bacteroidales bacterium]|jgi:cell division protein FtsB|nr:septum formation initiator family protein [Bacteroidales bacterium]
MGLKMKISALKERSRILRVLLNKFFIVTLAFVISTLFVSKNNAIRWIENKYNIYQQEKIIRQYREEIRKTDDKIKELTSDLDSLEKYAREHYYFLKENEEVFIVE